MTFTFPLHTLRIYLRIFANLWPKQKYHYKHHQPSPTCLLVRFYLEHGQAGEGGEGVVVQTAQLVVAQVSEHGTINMYVLLLYLVIYSLDVCIYLNFFK